MEFFEAIRLRRSCRRFTPEPVPPEIIGAALDAALLAPNSSNMQTWQFYWVRTEDKKTSLKSACLSQPAATTAQELIVAVSNRSVYDRNRHLIIDELKKNPKMPTKAFDYYQKLMPLVYTYGPLNSIGWLKKLLVSVVGLFRPVPRTPALRSELFEMMTKSTALACENFMLAIAAQGYASCPMEGFDECRVKRILGLGRNARITMVFGVGRAHPDGIWGPQFRIPRHLTILEV